MSKRETLIVGDIHGCFYELLDLLQKANFEPEKHELILIGDVINKGPYSDKVLDWIAQHSVTALMGNHEERLLSCLRGDRSWPPRLRELKNKWGLKKLTEVAQRIQQWPLFIERDHFIAVHAGVAPNFKLSETKPHILMNIRTWDGKGVDLNNPQDPAWHDLYKGKKLIVYGHWATQGLMMKFNSIGLDTGCVYGRELTAVWLPAQELVQVPAHKTYCSVS